jgi:uncharacterized protein (TIGR02285 family)
MWRFLSGWMLLASAAQAVERPEVHWVTFPIPPLYIEEGRSRGKGVLDRSLREWVLPRLRGWRHRVTSMPVQRALRELRENRATCMLGLLRNPEREQYLHFSQPLLVQLPPGVLTTSAVLPQLSSFLLPDGRLKLAEALDLGGLRLGLLRGRGYGSAVDRLVAERAERPQVFQSQVPRVELSLMRMLQRARLDLMLALPYEASFVSRNGDLEVADLHFIPLAEQPPLITGYVVCAKGRLGERVIAEVNQVLAQPAVREAIDGLYESWLDPESRARLTKLR